MEQELLNKRFIVVTVVRVNENEYKLDIEKANVRLNYSLVIKNPYHENFMHMEIYFFDVKYVKDEKDGQRTILESDVFGDSYYRLTSAGYTRFMPMRTGECSLVVRLTDMDGNEFRTDSVGIKPQARPKIIVNDPR